MRGPVRAGVSGANTVMTGLTRPWFVAARRWSAHSAAMSAALVHVPAVPDLQALPVQPPDAAAAVTPRHPRAELQLLERVPVGAGPPDLPADFPQPRPGRARAGDLAAVQLDELGGQIHVHGPGGPARAGERAGRNARPGHRDHPGRAGPGRASRAGATALREAGPAVKRVPPVR